MHIWYSFLNYLIKAQKAHEIWNAHFQEHLPHLIKLPRLNYGGILKNVIYFSFLYSSPLSPNSLASSYSERPKFSLTIYSIAQVNLGRDEPLQYWNMEVSTLYVN